MNHYLNKQFILTDFNSRLIEAWHSFFADYKNVVVIQGDLTSLQVDAIVSPANSFGFMDGGVDRAISERLGWHIEKELQQKIKALPGGELLVGTAMVLETEDQDIPFLISAPTMRVPTDFNISTSINAYLAMKAILLHTLADDRISIVAIPGLCTGTGKMDPTICARQMWFAYQEIVENKKMDFGNFIEAQRYHWDINPQGLGRNY